VTGLKRLPESESLGPGEWLIDLQQALQAHNVTDWSVTGDEKKPSSRAGEGSVGLAELPQDGPRAFISPCA
jgi:hypothetical protein